MEKNKFFLLLNAANEDRVYKSEVKGARNTAQIAQERENERHL